MAKKWAGLVASVFAKIEHSLKGGGGNDEESSCSIKLSNGRFVVLCLNLVIVIFII